MLICCSRGLRWRVVLSAPPPRRLRRHRCVPGYALDTSWPKLPLPNKWALGLINGIFVDANNHLWLYHSPEHVPKYALGAAANPPTGKCCVPAPAIIEFDEQGNVVRSWDIGPGPGL